MEWIKGLFGGAPPEAAPVFAGAEVSTSDHEERTLDAFGRHYGITFNRPELLQLALTHRSYLSVTGRGPRDSNERLEFLGDSVLGLVTSEYLYRLNPHEHEGQLTKTKSLLVSKAILSRRSLAMGLGRFVLMSQSEIESGGRQRMSILADAFESVVGAIYLDQGFEAAREFIIHWLLRDSGEIVADKRHMNYKSHLQEYVQSTFRTHPTYRIRSEVGPDHSKQFNVEVVVGRRVLGTGRGPNKKEAEQAAARNALEGVAPKREQPRASATATAVEETESVSERRSRRERSRRGGRGGRDRHEGEPESRRSREPEARREREPEARREREPESRREREPEARREREPESRREREPEARREREPESRREREPEARREREPEARREREPEQREARPEGGRADEGRREGREGRGRRGRDRDRGGRPAMADANRSVTGGPPPRDFDEPRELEPRPSARDEDDFEEIGRPEGPVAERHLDPFERAPRDTMTPENGPEPRATYEPEERFEPPAREERFEPSARDERTEREPEERMEHEAFPETPVGQASPSGDDATTGGEDRQFGRRGRGRRGRR